MIFRSLPNFITTLNLLCGCIGIVLVLTSHEYLRYGAYLVILACIFDFLDGFVAKLLNVKSEIGKQLDSLADVVTFGVLPSMMIFELLKLTYDVKGTSWINCQKLVTDYKAHIFCSLNEIIPFCPAFLIAIFSALRLAKFNIDTKQTEGFIGMPTPANALFVVSIVMMVCGEGKDFEFNEIINYNFLYMFIIASSFLMVSKLPMLSLKFSNFSFQKNLWRYILLITSILILSICYKIGVFYFGMFLTMSFYVVISIVSAFFQKS